MHLLILLPEGVFLLHNNGSMNHVRLAFPKKGSAAPIHHTVLAGELVNDLDKGKVGGSCS
jgi:hypothetical protein